VTSNETFEICDSLYPKEFDGVVACSRWPFSDGAAAHVRNLTSHSFDWNLFLAISRRHRVEGLVHHALAVSGVTVPEEIERQLSAESQRITRQNLSFAGECARLRTILDQAGVLHLFVKGITLGKLVYGTLALKKAWDIDLLVAAKDVDKVSDALALAGYSRSLPGPEASRSQMTAWRKLSKEMIWVHSEKAVVLELHWSLVDNPMLLPAISVDSPSQEVSVAPGMELTTLRTEELFAYLCVHGASSGWFRLKWIADVAALLAPFEQEEVASLYRSAVALEGGRACAVALLLAERLFGRRVPAGIEEHVRKDKVANLLVQIALRTMLRGQGTTEVTQGRIGTAPLHLYHLLMQPGWRYKVSELKRKSVSATDFLDHPLPRPLWFLYPILSLPFWIWRRARSGAIFPR
jgi:hypothetical protein